ncbi:hypothetical protein [Mucilaginibacter sp. SP1R1]|uniref:hypothetical protein n=1 Tax=Mucilaginibacter sp. SP1R1 TaxID=2723091 RepID=UPI00161CC9CF|nr:hypothetical protein [Mucilaginibacter sp. SP1R1]MBB6152347.1 hypothetical protein [Mucilaginibacter sp. SP1R1]
MNEADHVWNLVTKKLADEASGDELSELNTLMQANPDLNDTLKQVFELWDNGKQQKVENESRSLYKKIQKQVKAASRDVVKK